MNLPLVDAQGRIRRPARPDQFVAYILKRCDEPAARAGLRRGVGHHPESAHRSHAYVASWTTRERTDRSVSEAEEWAYYAVAAMIAAQPGQRRHGTEPDTEMAEATDPSAPAAAEPIAPRYWTNLGTSIAHAVVRRVISQDSAEKRLHLLTRQGLAGLHRHLPATVRHLRAENIVIDWGWLIRDLSRWTNDRDGVAKEWLQSYYRAVKTPSNPTTPGSAES